MSMDCKNVTGENDTGKSQLNILLEINEIAYHIILTCGDRFSPWKDYSFTY